MTTTETINNLKNHLTNNGYTNEGLKSVVSGIENLDSCGLDDIKDNFPTFYKILDSFCKKYNTQMDGLLDLVERFVIDW